MQTKKTTKTTRTLSYIPPGATLAYEWDHYDVYTWTVDDVEADSQNIDETNDAEMTIDTATRYEIVVRKPRVWLLMLTAHDVITLQMDHDTHDGAHRPTHGLPSATSNLAREDEYDTAKVLAAAQAFGHHQVGIAQWRYTLYDSYLRHNDIRTLDHLIVVHDTILSWDRNDYYTHLHNQQKSFGDFVQEAYETDFAAPHGFLMELHAAARSRASLNHLAEKIFMGKA